MTSLVTRSIRCLREEAVKYLETSRRSRAILQDSARKAENWPHRPAATPGNDLPWEDGKTGRFAATLPRGNPPQPGMQKSGAGPCVPKAALVGLVSIRSKTNSRIISMKRRWLPTSAVRTRFRPNSSHNWRASTSRS